MDSTNATLYGGSEVTVTKLDGTTEVVKVRQLLIRDFPDFLKLLDDEPGQVDFYCSKTRGWGDTLTPASFEAVLTEGDKLNSDFFSRWVQRRLEKQERVMPGLSEKIQNQVVSSLNSAPKPQSQLDIQQRRSAGPPSRG